MNTIFEKLTVEANKLFEKYGLIGWKLEFDNANLRFGICRYSKRIIGLSEKMVMLNAEKNYNEVYETLLHEIGHALSFQRYGVKGRGHGFLWETCVRELGGKPQRCYDSSKVEIVKGKFKYVCDKGHEQYFYKRLKRRYACSTCCKENHIHTFDERFVLKLVEE
jgi:predicted SprT family Zn-dependent metalloprotease